MFAFFQGATAITVVLLAVGTTSWAADKDTPQAPPAGLGFLETGKDYVIRFPEQSNVFKTTTGGVTSTSYTTDDGETKSGGPATWSMTLTVEIFRVVRFSGSSWVLLEHPSDFEDIAKWNGQRRAMATLAGLKHESFQAGSDGEKRLKELREAAAGEISTAETWVNLNHAIAIAPVSPTDAQGKLTVKSAKVTPKQ